MMGKHPEAPLRSAVDPDQISAVQRRPLQGGDISGDKSELSVGPIRPRHVEDSTSRYIKGIFEMDLFIVLHPGWNWWILFSSVDMPPGVIPRNWLSFWELI
jgi:hypothetical protein